MKDEQNSSIPALDAAKSADTTESGELERPVLRRRRIDCGGNPEVSDRRGSRNGGRRDTEPAKR